MTVGSVGSSSAPLGSWDEVDGGFSPTTVSGQLAVMMLETEESQKQVSRDMLEAARQDFADALADQVRAMRAAADAKYHGALAQVVLSVGAAGFGFASLNAGERSPEAVTSKGLGDIAQPVGTMLSKTYGEADAAQAEGAQKGAQWRIDDARDDIEESDALQDKALDWLASIVEQDAATMNAILANKV
jgi:hypothetical protein